VKQGLGRSLIARLHSRPLPMISTFYAPCLVADHARYEQVYCVICDADLNRVWVASQAKHSAIRYFAPCGRVMRRLRQYGVPDERIFITGFTLPRENIGGPGIVTVDGQQFEMAKLDWGKDGPPAIRYHGQPENDAAPTLLWDGEWEVTYVTFRDMGAAFIVAMLGIYLLVVAQFGSFKLPLVILTPVPLTLIGIMLGHWWLGAAFTATSMIGFIALAGIIVRNSILLVDFIRRRQAEGAGLRAALIDAGAARVKPIVLTAAAAMIGSAFILADPIFQGLAISLVFGLASSTALTTVLLIK